MKEQNETPEYSAPTTQPEPAASEPKPRLTPRRRPAKKKTTPVLPADDRLPVTAETVEEKVARAPVKTRRRRTRKPKAPDDMTATAGLEQQRAEQPAEPAVPPAETLPSANISTGDESAAPPVPGTGRRKRRRRRRGKKPQTGELSTASLVELPVAADSEPIPPNVEIAELSEHSDEVGAQPEKSRKRRRKRRGKKPADTESLATPDNEAAVSAEPALPRDTTKRILIHARFAEEQRVAIVEGNRLMDFYAESSSHIHLKGNIYKGIVEGLAPSLQAAFVDFGRKKRGFLQFREVMPELRRGESILEEGQEILVQVEQDERDTKGASLTTFISLPGRYIVMLPGQQKVGISRKIEDRDDRDRLKETFNALKLPKGMGFILRTACGDSLNEELDRDLKYLAKLWSRITADAKKAKAPKLVYQEHSVTMRALRDYLTSDTSEILIDDAEAFKETKSFLQKIMPWRTVNVVNYDGKDSLFGAFGVEKQIADLVNSRVKLPSGGTIVFDKAEALTAIDVNSAKSHKEDNIEATALSTNLEAAEEIARQLRLRDIGGLVVIDFIDMRSGRNRALVETRLKDSLSSDKASIEVLPISRFGLLEMTRERLRPAYAAAMWRTCQVCSGRGTVYSDDHVVLNALRELHALAESNPGSAIRCHLSVESANSMSNTKRHELAALEQQHQVTVQVLAEPSLHQGQYSLEVKKHK
ncbi:MAG TPA: Rne/Rng family ribonuclease [Dissulfurispiraceae bacterium]|nr:Rne/Rng family ribonuclease [Dissulfurispiraceae bacterium]